MKIELPGTAEKKRLLLRAVLLFRLLFQSKAHTVANRGIRADKGQKIAGFRGVTVILGVIFQHFGVDRKGYRLCFAGL